MILKTFPVIILISFYTSFGFRDIENEILENLNEIFNHSVPDNTIAFTHRTNNETKEIVNISCIIDKYGVGYMGSKNTTYDGTPCVEWSRNVLLYTRYKLRGKNISENYCRNPDKDSSGPWCFIAHKSIFKRQFKFKHCGIPQCSSKSNKTISGDVNVGVPLLLNRDCPTGFKKTLIEGYSTNSSFCVVQSEILNKLPTGQYSFQLLNVHANCPEGFKNENIVSNISLYCTKTDNSNDSIDFPKFSNPKPGDMIFMLLRPGSNASCPQMSSITSVIIRKSSDTNFFHRYFTICHYFYKLSNNKDFVDRKLAILVLQKECPKNWTSVSMSLRWRFMITMDGSYKRHSVYACIPSEELKAYPEGDYCLISLSSNGLLAKQCPEEFVDVDMKINGALSTKFCCRQSNQINNNNNYLFDFFNFPSLLIINSVNSCPKTSNRKNVQIKQYLFETLLYREKYECTNCELFNVFNTREYNFGKKWLYFRVQFRVCSFERSTSGFAYATLNSRCPPEMKYAYIKYAKDRYISLYSSKVTASFCTIVNYPSNIKFPDGRYCIYKLGLECPQGFQNINAKLPLYFYRYSDSGGDITNYQMDVYCCKFGSPDVNFENATLPYVTSNFEFGLPYANDSFNCIHGLNTHTAVEDSHMCHYYPTTDSTTRVSIVFPSGECEHRAYKYFGSYRLIYSTRSIIRYCYFFVNDSPPPGNYCAAFAKTCPSQYFYYVTYHPLLQRVICCRKPTPDNTKEKESTFTPSKWVNELKSFSLLAYKNKCPIFERYNYGKEPIKRYYYYRATAISQSHKKNLTDIGFDIVNSIRGYSLTMYSCDYKLDPYNKSVVWPHGQYAFPRPLNGCPSNFKSGNFTHSMETANPSFSHSDMIHLDGEYMIGGSNIKWGFCVKKDNYIKDKLFLPYGRYCLMKVDYTCPTGFFDGSVKFVEITAINTVLIQREGVLPKIDTNGPYITYYFCCQSGRGDVAHSPMYLPTESGSFYLLKFGTHCQRVFGMKYTEEFICIDSEDSSQYLNYTFQAPYKTEGLTPVTGSFIRGCDFQINLCFYEKDIETQIRPVEKPDALVSWPRGSYVMIKKLNDDCPEGFIEGNVTVQTFFRSYPKFMHTLMFGSVDVNTAIFSFCKRNSSKNEDSKPPEEWPQGNYCFIFEKKCPSGMLRHKLRSLENFIAKKQSGAPMTEWSNLCCMNDKSNTSNILPYFPGDYYSTIIKPSFETHSCPAHNNTRVALVDWQNEMICYYERRDESVEFPDGDYLIPAPPKPMNVCTTGFQLVKHHHSHLSEADAPSKILTFCQKEITKAVNKTFPRGNYCILTTRDNCPSNQFTIQNMLTIPMYHFSDTPSKFSRYLACCQSDNKVISNLVVQKTPFQLFGSSVCSYVDGMFNVHVFEEPTNFIQQSIVERPPYIKAENKIRICKYDQTSVWNYGSRCHCHQDAICLPSVDENNCQCKPGYFGDGKTVCTKVTNKTDPCGNSCAKNISFCAASFSGSYSCVCNEGYEGDGFKCKPSCKTRECNVFSRCIVDSSASHCFCGSGSVETEPNVCHGDLINTIYHLPGFKSLMQMNISCFSDDISKHLVTPRKDRILFLIIPLNTNIFSSCGNAKDYIIFTAKRDFFPDIMYQIKVKTESNKYIYVSKSEDNVWRINKDVKVVKRQLFTNAIVLYLDKLSQLLYEVSFDFSRKVEKNPNEVPKVLVILPLALLAVVAVVALGIFFYRKRKPVFNRLYETRSESNIHFITADEKIELDS